MRGKRALGRAGRYILVFIKAYLFFIHAKKNALRG